MLRSTDTPPPVFETCKSPVWPRVDSPWGQHSIQFRCSGKVHSRSYWIQSIFEGLWGTPSRGKKILTPHAVTSCLFCVLETLGQPTLRADVRQHPSHWTEPIPSCCRAAVDGPGLGQQVAVRRRDVQHATDPSSFSSRRISYSASLHSSTLTPLRWAFSRKHVCVI